MSKDTKSHAKMLPNLCNDEKQFIVQHRDFLILLLNIRNKINLRMPWQMVNEDQIQVVLIVNFFQNHLY